MIDSDGEAKTLSRIILCLQLAQSEPASWPSDLAQWAFGVDEAIHHIDFCMNRFTEATGHFSALDRRSPALNRLPAST
jgi:hypothetical protein